jgi:transposase
MAKKRSQHSADFKFRLALEAAKGQHTLNELASQHGVHPNQIGQWKRQLLERRIHPSSLLRQPENELEFPAEAMELLNDLSVVQRRPGDE